MIHVQAESGQRQLLLYAPNVHTGGGLVLLEAMLQAWPSGIERKIPDALASTLEEPDLHSEEA